MRVEEKSKFRYTKHHQRKGSESQQSHTLMSPDTVSQNYKSYRPSREPSVDESDVMDVDCQEEHQTSNKPHQPQVDILASGRKPHQNNFSMGTNSIRNIAPLQQVIFPFAAYMPTVESNVTGILTVISPLETVQGFSERSYPVSPNQPSPKTKKRLPFELEKAKYPSRISYQSLVQVGSPYELTQNGEF